MAVYLYFLADVISIFILIGIIYETRKHNESIYVLCGAAITVVNFGYWQLASAANFEEALLANRITYLDGTFVTLFMFLSLAHVCRLKVPIWLVSLMTLAGFVVLGLAFTGGYSTIYYKEVRYVTRAGAAFLVNEHGPAHILYLFLLGFYILTGCWVIYYACHHKNKVSYVSIMCISYTEFSCIAVYAIESIVDLEIELLPFIYVINEVLLFFMIRRSNLYDVSGNAENVREERQEYGYISFTGKGKYVGSNEVAQKYFPELSQLLIDREIPKNADFLYREFGMWMKNYRGEEEEVRYYNRKDRVIKCSMHFFTTGCAKQVRGYLIEILDDTRQQTQIHELNAMAKKAEEANLAKGAFLASISHEIRTPINAVLGMNEMILRESEEPQIRVYAGNIKKAGNSLLSLINNVLDYSRIEHGALAIQPVCYDVAKLLCDACSLMRVRARTKNLDLEVQADPDIPARLLGDDVRIRQILFNLLSNAVKYTKKGFVRLHVAVLERTEETVTLKVEVADSGIGIKTEDMEHLTEAFRRVDEEKNRKIEGTGLGLAITAQLLGKMGSRLDVTSEYGKGSVFSFELTQQLVDSACIGVFDMDAEEGAAEYQDPVEKFRAPEAKILVVDDNEMNLFIVKGLLRHLGATIDTADSGAACLKKTADCRYDLIFMDHLMPEMDGIETLHRLREDPENASRQAKVIMVTANAFAGARGIYLQEGFDDFTPKPVEGKKLEQIVYQYLPEELLTGKGQERAEKQELEEGFLQKLRLVEVDGAKGLAYANNEVELYTEILRGFVEEYEEKRQKMLDYVADLKRNGEDLVNLAHQMKGEARGIGGTHFGEHFYALELAGREKNTEKIRSLLPEVLEEWERTIRGISGCLG